MATNVMRIKWIVLGSFSRQKAEVVALVFILGIISLFISGLWTATRPVDGTFIDLSEQRQLKLIDELKKEQEFLGELKKRQDELDIQEGKESPDTAFHAHVNYLKDTKDGLPQDRNLTKHIQENRLLGGEPKLPPKPSKPVNVTKNTLVKTKKMVKFYDPSQGKMVLMPAIVEESPLQGGPGHCTVYDISTNITDEFDCTSLNIKPVTHICLYPDEQDVHISKHIREEGIWEPHIVKDFQNILYGDLDIAVVDIGANIGEYSLLAANMGHKVVAVEPFIDNIKRLQKGAQLGHVEDKIIIIQNAISDKRGKWFLNLKPTNQGGVSLQLENPNPDCIEESCRAPTVQTIYMDDLLEVITFDKAIIKIDIEGNEHRAFLFSDRFLDKVYVPYIFMEWMKLRQYYGAEITESEDKDLTQRLVKFLTKRGYTAYSSVTMDRLNVDWWVSWTDDIIWKHELREFNR